MTNSDELTRLHVFVKGLVQGVGFRYFVLDISGELGITGWVRNTYRGDVEVIAEGKRGDLEKLISALHQGPRSAIVEDVDIRWESPTGEFRAFYIGYTGA